MSNEIIEQAINEGNVLAEKISKAITIEELDSLSDEIEKYLDFVNENFGVIDVFSEHANEKYCDLTFYIHVAKEEKADHLEYYNSHPDIISDGMQNFLNYLNSKEWANIENAE